MRFWNRAVKTIGFGACALLASGFAQSQQVYRVVGPDGKVTFTDQAPNTDSATTLSRGGVSAPTTNSNLPFALKGVAGKYPVTIYTGADCGPCTSLRAMLVQRGVPFVERSVTSNEDVNALKNLSGGNNLPFGSIGGQKLSGYSDTEWVQYLDAAGYPKQSQLPPSYRQPAATPLVATAAAPAPTATTSAADGKEAPRRRTQPAPAPVGGPTPSNPTGIVF